MKYRRIEVNAFRRRVTIISSLTGDESCGIAKLAIAQGDEGVVLSDSDLCEPVAPDSPEGQLLLIEAVRSLEQRLAPEARAMILLPRPTPAYPKFYLALQSFLGRWPKALRSAKKHMSRSTDPDEGENHVE